MPDPQRFELQLSGRLEFKPLRIGHLRPEPPTESWRVFRLSFDRIVLSVHTQLPGTPQQLVGPILKQYDEWGPCVSWNCHACGAPDLHDYRTVVWDGERLVNRGRTYRPGGV